MNSDLIKLIFKIKFTEETTDKNKPKQFFEDDFSSQKRANRIFTNKQKDQCWNMVRKIFIYNTIKKYQAQKIPYRDPDRWRYDAVGNPVVKALKGCHGPLCHEYDHIIPFSKGGETILRNCQVLQTSVNKYKSNKTELAKQSLQNNSYKLKLSEYEMDLVEEVIYGNVKKMEI